MRLKDTSIRDIGVSLKLRWGSTLEKEIYKYEQK